MGSTLGTFIDIAGQKFQIKDELSGGKGGGFARVVSVQHQTTSEKLALKIMKVAKDDESKAKVAEWEMSLNEMLPSHPNIVHCEATSKHVSKNETEFYMLLDLCTGGSLREQLESKDNDTPKSVQEALEIFIQVCGAVSHLHRQDPPIAHRDLKADNILMHEGGQYKLCDLGSCSIMDAVVFTDEEAEELKTAVELTTEPRFRAPELMDVAMAKERGYRINTKVDIWSLGCLLYELLFKDTPFDDDSSERICRGDFLLPAAHGYDEAVIQLLSSMMEVDPADRPDINEVIEAVVALGISPPAEPRTQQLHLGKAKNPQLNYEKGQPSLGHMQLDEVEVSAPSSPSISAIETSVHDVRPRALSENGPPGGQMAFSWPPINSSILLSDDTPDGATDDFEVGSARHRDETTPARAQRSRSANMGQPESKEAPQKGKKPPSPNPTGGFRWLLARLQGSVAPDPSTFGSNDSVCFKAVAKSTNEDMIVPKPKHVRKLIILSWEHCSLPYFYSNILKRPMHASPIVGYKALFVLHKLWLEGHPHVLEEGRQHDGLLDDFINAWEANLSSHETLSNMSNNHQFACKVLKGTLIAYPTYLKQKLRFHRRFLFYEGNYALSEFLSGFVAHHSRQKRKSNLSDEEDSEYSDSEIGSSNLTMSYDVNVWLETAHSSVLALMDLMDSLFSTIEIIIDHSQSPNLMGKDGEFATSELKISKSSVTLSQFRFVPLLPLIDELLGVRKTLSFLCSLVCCGFNAAASAPNNVMTPALCAERTQTLQSQFHARHQQCQWVIGKIHKLDLKLVRDFSRMPATIPQVDLSKPPAPATLPQESLIPTHSGKESALCHKFQELLLSRLREENSPLLEPTTGEDSKTESDGTESQQGLDGEHPNVRSTDLTVDDLDPVLDIQINGLNHSHTSGSSRGVSTPLDDNWPFNTDDADPSLDHVPAPESWSKDDAYLAATPSRTPNQRTPDQRVHSRKTRSNNNSDDWHQVTHPDPFPDLAFHSKSGASSRTASHTSTSHASNGSPNHPSSPARDPKRTPLHKSASLTVVSNHEQTTAHTPLRGPSPGTSVRKLHTRDPSAGHTRSHSGPPHMVLPESFDPLPAVPAQSLLNPESRGAPPQIFQPSASLLQHPAPARHSHPRTDRPGPPQRIPKSRVKPYRSHSRTPQMTSQRPPNGVNHDSVLADYRPDWDARHGSHHVSHSNGRHVSHQKVDHTNHRHPSAHTNTHRPVIRGRLFGQHPQATVRYDPVDENEIGFLHDAVDPRYPELDVAPPMTEEMKALYGEIDFDQLTLGQRIGIGAFAEVFKGEWRDTPVAIKCLLMDRYKSPKAIEEFRAEVALIRQLRHPNIVMFMAACTRPPQLCVVTELLRGSLFDLLHNSSMKLSWLKKLHIALEAASGMNFLHLHPKPIIHRDLKSPNLLLDRNYHVKVCDFGLARTKAVNTMTGQVGTFQWMAPEVITNNKYSEKADVYSFGVILWELVSERVPYQGLNAVQVSVAVTTKGLRPRIPEECPDDYADLIEACWHQDPEERPSFSQISRHLQAICRQAQLTQTLAMKAQDQQLQQHLQM